MATDANGVPPIPHQDAEAELDITLLEEGAQALLRHYPHVQTLYVRYQTDEEQVARPYSVTAASIEGMFSTLGDHQSIQHLVLDNLSEMEGDVNCRCRFPIRSLTLFLQKAKSLKSLQLDMDTALEGSQEEGKAFLEAVRQHPALTVLEIGDFGNERSTINPSDFSPLSVPRWEELTISHTGDQITAQQVDRSIVQSKCLKKLLIDTSSGSFPDQHLARIFQGLHNNKYIEELNLLDDLDCEKARDCATMIRENSTLNRLFVSPGNQGAIITQACLQNSHIHSLRFVLSSQPKADAVALVQNLRHNQTLRRIHFHFQGSFHQKRVREDFLKPFEDIIEDNSTLEDIRMDKCHGAFELTDKIEFYLSLNRAGRKELLQTQDQNLYRSLWVGKVIQNHQNESIVFYLLSQNPSLLTALAGNNSRKRKRTT